LVNLYTSQKLIFTMLSPSMYPISMVWTHDPTFKSNNLHKWRWLKIENSPITKMIQPHLHPNLDPFLFIQHKQLENTDWVIAKQTVSFLYGAKNCHQITKKLFSNFIKSFALAISVVLKYLMSRWISNLIVYDNSNLLISLQRSFI